MPEITDDNIQKVKEQLQNLGQKAREAIGPEKAAAISASVPVVKSAARSAARQQAAGGGTDASRQSSGRQAKKDAPQPLHQARSASCGAL